MFIGYQRSGHSILGALIDAHPNAAMGMEVDALNLLQANYSRNQLFYCLVRNAEVFTTSHHNIWTGYDYHVPGMSQGKYSELQLIGDKKGGKSTLRLGEDSSLIERLAQLTKCEVKVLHVIRHPFDNIATMIMRNTPNGEVPDKELIQEKIDLYFRKVQINSALRSRNEINYLDVYHENFIVNTQKVLYKIMDFLGLEPIESYIEACTSIIKNEPNLSRKNFSWPQDMLEQVMHRAGKYDFLRNYQY